MEFFKQNTKINFMRVRKVAYTFSLVLFLISLISLGVRGLNFGLDFTGGTQLTLTFPTPINLADVRHDLIQQGYTESSVQTFGSDRTILVTVPVKKQGDSQTVIAQKVLQAMPTAHMDEISFIGAQVGSELAYKGILAVIVALLGTMIYIAFRFEYRLALSAALALIHDPILILGIFSLFGITFDLTALAAVLTVLGYSLNDTIVVFDRIRENFRKMRQGSPFEVVNAAINQTLSRTIMTSGLTLVVVCALFFFGGPSIHGFSLALIIGIVVGTYSSYLS